MTKSVASFAETKRVVAFIVGYQDGNNDIVK